MKLYTDKQVLRMLEVCRDSDLYEHILTFEDIFKTETPIELPSDEEIVKEAMNHIYNNGYTGFTCCVFWMKNKIQGGNNEQQ